MLDPLWLMRAAQRVVRISKNSRRLAEDGSRRVRVRLPSQRAQPSLATSIPFVLHCGPVMSAVVFRKAPRTGDPQIGARDQSTGHLDDELRLNRDRARGVQDPQQCFPGRLGTSIDQGKRPAKRSGPTSAQPGGNSKLRFGALAHVQRAIHEDHQIQQRHQPRAGEDRFDRGGDLKPMEANRLDACAVPGNAKSDPARARLFFADRDVRGQIRGQVRQPPATKRSRRQSGERHFIPEKAAPGVGLLGGRARLVDRYVAASGYPTPSGPAHFADQDWTLLCRRVG